MGDFDEDHESPIPGMSRNTFEAIYDENFKDELQESINKRIISNLETKLVTKTQANVCAICLLNYKMGDKVFVLECSHHFHTVCIEKWI